MKKEGIELKFGESRHSVGYGSDVWLLAYILLGLLIGKKNQNSVSEEPVNNIFFVSTKADEDNSLGKYMGWMEIVSPLLETKIGSEFVFFTAVVLSIFEFCSRELSSFD